jgi:hypothetical protein
MEVDAGVEGATEALDDHHGFGRRRRHHLGATAAHTPA